MSEFGEIRAVSFDLDGTLYSARRVRRQFFIRNFFSLRAVRVRQAVRAELRPKEFENGRAFFDEELRMCAERLELDVDSTQKTLGRLFGERLCACLSRVGPRPETKAVLTGLLDAGIKIAVVSDFSVDDKLAALGLSGIPFAATIAADGCGALKPHRRSFDMATAALGVPASSILHVGDRSDTDVEGARAAHQIPFLLTAEPDPTNPFEADSLMPVLNRINAAQS